MTGNVKDAAKDEKAGKGHNSRNRDKKYVAEQSQKLVAALEPLETERKKISDKITKEMRTFKALTGITAADFRAARRLAELEDEDEQKEKMDNMALVFNGLAHGTQLSFFEKKDA